MTSGRRGAGPVTLALAFAAGVGWLGFPGLLWDVAWHRTVGRDSFLSPPHVLMYAGVAASGALACWAMLTPARRLRGLQVVAAGFLMAIAGAVLDEAWHRLVGKDVNLWSPPHLVGLAGTVLIVFGLVYAIAEHSRFAAAPDGRWVAAVLLLFFADLLHKATVALDHYTLDAWGRTPDFYLFLLTLFLPAILMSAHRTAGRWGATGAAVAFTLQHVAIVLALRAAGMRTSTLSPFVLLPALAIDLGARRMRARGAGGDLAAALAGACAGLVLVGQETAWMAWVEDRPWDRGRVLAALPAHMGTAAASGWVGWTIGTFIRAAGEGRSAADLLGGVAGLRRALAGLAILGVLGGVAAYRPSRAEAPARLADLGLIADPDFDHRDAVFWEAQLPDDWRIPGVHETYQEGIVDGRPFPLGPAWCAPDEAGLAREMASIAFALTVNGEPVPLERFPAVRRQLRDGAVCHWIAVSAATPRPGRQVLRYDVRYTGALAGVTAGPATATTIVELRIKEP